MIWEKRDWGCCRMGEGKKCTCTQQMKELNKHYPETSTQYTPSECFDFFCITLRNKMFQKHVFCLEGYFIQVGFSLLVKIPVA
jgi:hypothetical protein